ncbi:MAG: ABC transporter ATP-binding protein [Planctomycetota bacterium]|nr:MAG: ABC transporter ATP-binding protein [Planctomycetota bacterium]REK40684.1 MAG: ABC transporter ATP-binding protein [Planctomycetota bacterium]
MIETRRLTKQFGDFVAVKQLNLELQEGDVFGFIGPNGSGKTTTMRMLATLLDPTSGEGYVCGHSIYTHRSEIRRLIGYMPDFFGVYDDMKVIEYLEFFAATYRINGKARREVCERVLEMVDLTFKRDRFANTLSRGQTQRLGLARVLLHDPQVLLLDEPASGLDPRARIKMRELIKRLGEMGKTVLVSSHILPELADVCNRIGIIERGELIVNEAVVDVLRQVRKQPVLEIAVAGSLAEARALLEQETCVEQVETRRVDGAEQLLVTLAAGEDRYGRLATLLVQGGVELTLFKEQEVNLETAFLTLTQGIRA